jgi:hypothetical protein
MKGTRISNTFIHRFLQGGAQHALYKSHTGYALMHHTPACLAETNPPSGQEKGKENLMKIVRLFITICKDPKMARLRDGGTTMPYTNMDSFGWPCEICSKTAVRKRE